MRTTMTPPLSVVDDMNITDTVERIAECCSPKIATELVRIVNAYDILRMYCRHAHALLVTAHEPYTRSQRRLANTRAAQEALGEGLDATRQVVTNE